jgi:hypothetical protein
MERDRLYVWVAVLAFMAGACLMWLGTHPEPCNDPNTTACAVPYRGPH